MILCPGPESLKLRYQQHAKLLRAWIGRGCLRALTISIHLEHQTATTNCGRIIAKGSDVGASTISIPATVRPRKPSFKEAGLQMDANGNLEESAQQLFGLLNLALVLRQNRTLFPEAWPLLLNDLNVLNVQQLGMARPCTGLDCSGSAKCLRDQAWAGAVSRHRQVRQQLWVPRLSPQASAQNAETLCRRLMVSLVSLTSLPGFCFHSLVCSNEPVGRALQPRLLPFHHLSLEFIDLFLFSNYLTCWKTLQGQSCESRAKSQAIDKLSKRPAAWLKITAMACAAAPCHNAFFGQTTGTSAILLLAIRYNMVQLYKLDKPILTQSTSRQSTPDWVAGSMPWSLHLPAKNGLRDWRYFCTDAPNNGIQKYPKGSKM